MPGYVSALLEYEAKTRVEPSPFAAAKPWLEEYMNEHSIDTKFLTQVKDDQVLLCAKFDTAWQESVIDLVSFLKMLNIPFQLVNCTKKSGNIQLSSEAYKHSLKF